MAGVLAVYVLGVKICGLAPLRMIKYETTSLRVIPLSLRVYTLFQNGGKYIILLSPF